MRRRLPWRGRRGLPAAEVVPGGAGTSPSSGGNPFHRRGLWVVQLSVCHTEEILQGTAGVVESHMEGSHLHAWFMVGSQSSVVLLSVLRDCGFHLLLPDVLGLVSPFPAISGSWPAKHGDSWLLVAYPSHVF